jgi:hypothetical protein
MSLLRKIITTIRPDHAHEAIENSAPATPTDNSFTAETTLVAHPVVESEEDDNPWRQRRYFVKTGRYVDYEEEASASQSASAEAVIFDRPPADLKSLFPRLSLR